MYDLRHTRTHDLKCLLSSHLIMPFSPSLCSEGITTKALLENSRDSVISQCGIWFEESGRCEENLICERVRLILTFECCPWLVASRTLFDHPADVKILSWCWAPATTYLSCQFLGKSTQNNQLSDQERGSQVPLERNYVFVHIPAVSP